jgi:mannose-6-phosphate isomerase-like protein (cupin superfamily)
VHEGDQLVYVIEGTAEVVVSGEHGPLAAGEIVTIPVGRAHRLYNTGTTPRFPLTIYAPPAY